jgi:hypothetical protein
MPIPLAHAFGARYELPIPLLAFLIGGAVVVGVSFLIVLPTEVRERPAGRDETHVRSVTPTAGVVGVVLLGLLAWAGLAGTQEIAENILPTVFWVYVWVVVPLLCGLIGDFTSGSNPFGFLAQLGDRLRGGRAPLRWPRALGYWPAALLAAAATLAELVFNASTTLPRFIAWMLIGYAALNVLMGALFGAPAWRARGELFTVLFDLWGRLGWFRFGAPGRRGLAGGLAVPFERTVSRTVFVLLLLVSISFDGILSTPQWGRFEKRVLSFGDVHGQEALRTGSFFVLVVVIYGVFALFAGAVSAAGGRHRGVGETLAGLLPSLVPIAFGYLLAHYLQYVLVNGQLILPLLGAPGGPATNLHLPYPFNDSYEVHTQPVPNGFFWYVDVAVIVGVHVLAVVLAHRQLATTGRTEHLARRAEYPWIAAMIAYTCLSLWLLAQPLTETPTKHTAAAQTPIGCQTVFVSTNAPSRDVPGSADQSASFATTRFTLSAAATRSAARSSAATALMSIALTSRCDASHGASSAE